MGINFALTYEFYQQFQDVIDDNYILINKRLCFELGKGGGGKLYRPEPLV